MTESTVKSEFVFHTLLGLFSLFSSVCLYAVGADAMCNGDGTGQNEVLLLCQNYGLMVPVVLNLVAFGGLPSLLLRMRVRPVYRIVVSIGAVCLMMALSPFFPGSPFLIVVS